MFLGGFDNERLTVTSQPKPNPLTQTLPVIILFFFITEFQHTVDLFTL